jgi:hypothetical protein
MTTADRDDVIGFRVLIEKTSGSARMSAPIMFEKDAKRFASELLDELPGIERVRILELPVPDYGWEPGRVQPIQSGQRWTR